MSTYKIKRALIEIFSSIVAIIFVAAVLTSIIGGLLMFVWWAFNPGWLMFTLRAIFSLIVFFGLIHELNKWART